MTPSVLGKDRQALELSKGADGSNISSLETELNEDSVLRLACLGLSFRALENK